MTGPATGPADLSPVCPRCHRRHLPTLPCWGGEYVQTIRAVVLETYGTDCWICGQPGATTSDHLQPRSRGGTDALANLRPAHPFCNTGRGAGDPGPSGSVATEQSEHWL